MVSTVGLSGRGHHSHAVGASISRYVETVVRRCHVIEIYQVHPLSDGIAKTKQAIGILGRGLVGHLEFLRETGVLLDFAVEKLLSIGQFRTVFSVDQKSVLPFGEQIDDARRTTFFITTCQT